MTIKRISSIHATRNVVVEYRSIPPFRSKNYDNLIKAKDLTNRGALSKSDDSYVKRPRYCSSIYDWSK